MTFDAFLKRLALLRLSVLAPATAFLMLFAATSVEAQVVVYRIEFTKEQGINYHPFNGGYFAAPILGGTGSFLMTSNDGALTFSESDTSGSLFTATKGNEKKAVISATTGSSSTTSTGGTAGAFVALGDVIHTLHVNSPTVSLTVKVAESLNGMSVSADSESTATAPAADGSIGSAGYAKIKFVLDEGQTNTANSQGLSLTQTMEQLKLVLQRQGYGEETTDTGTGTGTGTGTDTGTGTGTGTDTGTGTTTGTDTGTGN